jgi:hypothetical protein
MANSAFEDLEDDGNYGVLAGVGGGGASHLDRVVTTINPNGIATTCHCGRCGTKNAIDISWQEVIMGSLGYLPPGWEAVPSSGVLYPNVGCNQGGCNYALKVGYAPSELKRYVSSGIEKGFITKQAAEAYAAQVLQSVGRR